MLAVGTLKLVVILIFQALVLLEVLVAMELVAVHLVVPVGVM